MKIIAVLPAYNAAKTLKKTVDDIPGLVDEIILVDDASKDSTVQKARELGLVVYEHPINRGYGGNQKTCYTEALKRGADVAVMVHPDYQYDPKVVPELINPIVKNEADAVFGSRILGGGALKGGMPVWKYVGNIFLTAFENFVLGLSLSEHHSGFRAYSGRLLKTVNFMANSDSFVFDTEIIAQIKACGYRITEVPISTRYFDEASSIGFWPAVEYGLRIIHTMCKYILWKFNLKNSKLFPKRTHCSV